MAFVWECFGRLAETRATQVIAGPTGALPVPAPIAFSEIEAFRRVALCDLTAADVELIRALDRQFIRIASGLPDPEKPKPGFGASIRARAGR